MTRFKAVDKENDNTRTFDTRAEAEDAAKEMRDMFGVTVEVSPVSDDTDSQQAGGQVVAQQSHDEIDEEGTSAKDVEAGFDNMEPPAQEAQSDPIPDDTPIPQKADDGAAQAIDQLKGNIEDDPLDVLPSYMITHVDGEPSLNKRGISVLAYHYDIDVVDRDVVAYPHENGYETAVVEILVQNEDGRTFPGVGEAHVDETPKHQLLRMAETRAYKRAVIFATGTGIVGYQELMGELE